MNIKKYIGKDITIMKGNIPRTGRIIWDTGLIPEVWYKDLKGLITGKRKLKYDWWFYSEENNYKELAKYAIKYIRS